MCHPLSTLASGNDDSIIGSCCTQIGDDIREEVMQLNSGSDIFFDSVIKTDAIRVSNEILQHAAISGSVGVTSLSLSESASCQCLKNFQIQLNAVDCRENKKKS